MSAPRRPALRRNLKSSPSMIVLILLWLVAVAGALLSTLPGFAGWAVVMGLASFAFMLVLIVRLSRQPPYAADLPPVGFLLTPRINLGVALALLLVGLVVVIGLGLVVGPAVGLLVLSALLGLGLVITWRGQLTRRLVGVLSGLGIAFLGNGDRTWAIFNLVTLPSIFIGGALLVQRTGLAQIRLLHGDYARALQGFLWGCVLALPPALLNLLGGVQADDTWVRHGWQPLYALVPGLAEETWARLFLTTLCYALLRPAVNHRPRLALLVAILVGALVHGFGHTDINPLGLVIGSLLYGLPAALLLIKRDFESAVGYHAFIDFVRYVAALVAA